MNRSFLNHSQPSNLEVTVDVLLLATAVGAGVVAGIGLIARDLIGRAFGR